MKVNRGAGRSAVPVDPRLMDVLKQSRRWWKISEGAFDPSVAPILKLWGIPDGDGPGTYPPPLDYLQPALKQVGMDKVILDDITNTVRLEREEMSLDLGGIARGFAIDAAVRILQEGGVTSARVEVGNDARVFGGAPGGGPWVIPVPHPRDPEILLAELALEEGAVSTSLDTTKQVFVAASQKYYTHIVSPATGEPVEWVASFTVVAPEATTADAVSPACFVKGKGEGLQLVKQLDEVEAMVVWFEKENVSLLKPSGTFGIRELLKSGPNVGRDRP
jgi:thiamine biosynthesis lipoprotein